MAVAVCGLLSLASCGAREVVLAQPTAVVAGSNQVTVSWSAASAQDAGAVVTGYKVTPYLAGVAKAQKIFASATTTQTITGLTAGEVHTFRIRATFDDGTGTGFSRHSDTVRVLGALALEGGSHTVDLLGGRRCVFFDGGERLGLGPSSCGHAESR